MERRSEKWNGRGLCYGASVRLAAVLVRAALQREVPAVYRNDYPAEVLEDLRAKTGLRYALARPLGRAFAFSFEQPAATAREVLEHLAKAGNFELAFRGETVLLDAAAGGFDEASKAVWVSFAGVHGYFGNTRYAGAVHQFIGILRMICVTEKLIALLRCPITNESLELSSASNTLVTTSSGREYRISESGVFELFGAELPKETAAQQAHYNRIAGLYVENLSYPHTQEYHAYLDQALKKEIASAPLGTTLELCCGAGGSHSFINDSCSDLIGLDVSSAMLAEASKKPAYKQGMLIHGDATNIPLKDNTMDTVVMLGGVHHVQNRQRLFAEVNRVLKANGRFIFREPLDDFFLWRGIRRIVYRLSPSLDHETESPLRWRDTVPVLEAEAFKLESWKTCGFVGFCLFMNSDVLVFNRLFRFIPFIRQITRCACRIDDWTGRMPYLKRNGLIVIGTARKQ